MLLSWRPSECFYPYLYMDRYFGAIKIADMDVLGCRPGIQIDIQ